MKQKTYIILILLVGLFSCTDSLPPTTNATLKPLSVSELNLIVDTIAENNKVECDRIGITGELSTIYQKYILLKNGTPEEMLLDLLHHDSLAVVVYSSFALIDRELVSPSEIFGRFINNNEIVYNFCGCTNIGLPLYILIYDYYWNERIRFADDTSYIVNDSEELLKMDLMILDMENPGYLLYKALNNRVYDVQYASKIEEQAFNKKSFSAIQYVFKNFSNGNEKKIKAALNEKLEESDISLDLQSEIHKMLQKLS